jgi:plastocyanin
MIAMKFPLVLVTAVAALGLLAACSASDSEVDGPAATGGTEIVVKNTKYTPRVIEVPAGTTVTWSFQDGDTPHDVKGDGFQSEVLRSGTFAHTFDRPGTYDYRCTLHSQQTGRVIVTD